MDSTLMHFNNENPLFARESKGNPPTKRDYSLFLGSVRTVSRYKVHKKPKTAVAFATSFLFLLASFLLYTGDVFFQWARFCKL